jgi:hypothetical protein
VPKDSAFFPTTSNNETERAFVRRLRKDNLADRIGGRDFWNKSGHKNKKRAIRERGWPPINPDDALFVCVCSDQGRSIAKVEEKERASKKVVCY